MKSGTEQAVHSKQRGNEALLPAAIVCSGPAAKPRRTISMRRLQRGQHHRAADRRLEAATCA
jgi:hypothetical protein